MRAPQADADKQKRVAVGFREDEIAGDEHRHAGHEDVSRPHPVAQRAGGIGEDHVGKVEQCEGERREPFGETDLDAFEDQEGL